MQKIRWKLRILESNKNYIIWYNYQPIASIMTIKGNHHILLYTIIWICNCQWRVISLSPKSCVNSKLWLKFTKLSVIVIFSILFQREEIYTNWIKLPNWAWTIIRLPGPNILSWYMLIFYSIYQKIMWI